MKILAPATQAVTMSSREIAELTGKNHADVCRDIRSMLSALYSGEDRDYIRKADLLYLTNQGVECIQYDSSNPNAWEYLFNRRHTEILVTGYDVKRRAAVIDRWFALESSPTQPMIPQSLPEALRLAADLAEQKAALEHKVEEMQPYVEALERIAKSDGSMCVTDAAKQLQVKPKVLFDLMSHNKWIYRRVGTPWVGYQDKIQQGLIEHKVTVVTKPDGEEKTVSQVRITPKGISKLAKMFSVGVAA
ncbi:phage regulatory protein/antirepressor Ant [Xenorhabdus sp. Flor]|nr:phage regulatory protein/antirepressor Ant [Xenorhabdus sp. Flor]